MAINECDTVKTLVDKKFDNGFVPAGTIADVMLVVEKSDKTRGFILERNEINEEDPLFGFDEKEIQLVKHFK